MDDRVTTSGNGSDRGGVRRLSRGDIANMAARVDPAEAVGALRVPLYLVGGARAVRVYLDGPALAVSGTRKSAGRYPLHRVSRVVVSGRVEWAAAALAACMEHGIPITFLRRTGEPLGSLQPARRHAGAVWSAVEEFLRNPRWPEVYENWLRSSKARAARAWARAAGWQGLDERLRITVYQASRTRALGPGTSVGWLASLVAECLAAAGLRPGYWGLGGGRLELASDLSVLLHLYLDAYQETSSPIAGSAWPELLELRAPELRGMCRHHIQDFLLRVRRFLDDGT